MDPKELAWAGGLFEGEGCFTLGQGQPRVRINSTDRDVLERFQAALGLGVIYGPYEQKGIGKKPIFAWSAYAHESTRAFHALAPWLSPRRRERAVEVLTERWDHRAKTRPLRPE